MIKILTALEDAKVREFLEYIGCDLKLLKNVKIETRIDNAGILEITEERYAKNPNQEEGEVK